MRREGMSATTAALRMRQGVPDPAEPFCRDPLVAGFSAGCDRLTVETLFDPLSVDAPRAVWLRSDGDGR